MGVKGLWDLLGATGKRVEVQALGNKSVAVDISIWINQFVKAMRSQDGTSLPNAHIIGTFRRLCKLLFMKVRPVLVFDGAAPVLKHKTTQRRKKLREKSATQITKLAEQLLRNQIRAHMISKTGAKGGEQTNCSANSVEGSGDGNPTKFDFSPPVNSTERFVAPEPSGANGSADGQIHAAVGSAGKEKEAFAAAGSAASPRPTAAKQKESVEKSGVKRKQSVELFEQVSEVDDEDEDEDEDEEDARTSKFGERVALRLPPGADYHDVKNQLHELPLLMQYETLQQLKEERRATNRGVFTAVRNDPAAYSQVQFTNYVKNSMINAHIDGVRTRLAGSNLLTTADGTQVPAKRIISDASAEYILYKTNEKERDDRGASEGTNGTSVANSGPISQVGAYGPSYHEDCLDESGSSVSAGHTISMRKPQRLSQDAPLDSFNKDEKSLHAKCTVVPSSSSDEDDMDDVDVSRQIHEFQRLQGFAHSAQGKTSSASLERRTTTQPNKTPKTSHSNKPHNPAHTQGHNVHSIFTEVFEQSAHNASETAPVSHTASATARVFSTAAHDSKPGARGASSTARVSSTDMFGGVFDSGDSTSQTARVSCGSDDDMDDVHVAGQVEELKLLHGGRGGVDGVKTHASTRDDSGDDDEMEDFDVSARAREILRGSHAGIFGGNRAGDMNELDVEEELARIAHGDDHTDSTLTQGRKLHEMDVSDALMAINRGKKTTEDRGDMNSEDLEDELERFSAMQTERFSQLRHRGGAKDQRSSKELAGKSHFGTSSPQRDGRRQSSTTQRHGLHDMAPRDDGSAQKGVEEDRKKGSSDKTLTVLERMFGPKRSSGGDKGVVAQNVNRSDQYRADGVRVERAPVGGPRGSEVQGGGACPASVEEELGRSYERQGDGDSWDDDDVDKRRIRKSGECGGEGKGGAAVAAARKFLESDDDDDDDDDDCGISMRDVGPCDTHLLPEDEQIAIAIRESLGSGGQSITSRVGQLQKRSESAASKQKKQSTETIVATASHRSTAAEHFRTSGRSAGVVSVVSVLEQDQEEGKDKEEVDMAQCVRRYGPAGATTAGVASASGPKEEEDEEEEKISLICQSTSTDAGRPTDRGSVRESVREEGKNREEEDSKITVSVPKGEEEDKENVVIIGVSKDDAPEKVEEVYVCCVCHGLGPEGQLKCMTCGFIAHSWCVYKRGSEEEENAMDESPMWSCDVCAGKRPSNFSSRLEKEQEGSHPYPHPAGDPQNEVGSDLESSSTVSGGGKPGAGVRGVAGHQWGPSSKRREESKLLAELGYTLNGGILSAVRGKARSFDQDTGTTGTADQKGQQARARIENRSRVTKARGVEGGEEDVSEGLLKTLQDEMATLAAQKSKIERQSEIVTDNKLEDVMQLCELFGVPYVLSPSEAEAQCAELERLKLVDGIVTDDCDVFLFGGRNIFKNIFSDKKYVEWYTMESVERELRLDREKLINMAQLLGSDYTEGVRGVGIVNAFECALAFKGHNGLKEFRNWVYTPEGSYDFTRETNTAEDVRLRKEFSRRHAKIKRTWEVGHEFPSDAVRRAYLEPIVDKSAEEFEWGEPDVDGLVDFMSSRVGWSTDEIMSNLKPVMEAARTHVVQTRIDQFAQFFHRAAKIKSQRVARVLQQLNHALDSDILVDDLVTDDALAHATRESETPARSAGRKRATQKRSKAEQTDGPGEAPAAKRRRRKKDLGKQGQGQGGVGVGEGDVRAEAARRDERVVQDGGGEEEEDDDEDEDEDEMRLALELSLQGANKDVRSGLRRDDDDDDDDDDEDDEDDDDDDDEMRLALELSLQGVMKAYVPTTSDGAGQPPTSVGQVAPTSVGAGQGEEVSEYERQRHERIKRNNEVLRRLGIERLPLEGTRGTKRRAKAGRDRDERDGERDAPGARRDAKEDDGDAAGAKGGARKDRERGNRETQKDKRDAQKDNRDAQKDNRDAQAGESVRKRPVRACARRAENTVRTTPLGSTPSESSPSGGSEEGESDKDGDEWVDGSTTRAEGGGGGVAARPKKKRLLSRAAGAAAAGLLEDGDDNTLPDNSRVVATAGSGTVSGSDRDINGSDRNINGSDRDINGSDRDINGSDRDVNFGQKSEDAGEELDLGGGGFMCEEDEEEFERALALSLQQQ